MSLRLRFWRLNYALSTCCDLMFQAVAAGASLFLSLQNLREASCYDFFSANYSLYKDIFGPISLSLVYVDFNRLNFR